MVEKVCFTIFLCLSACLATLFPEVNGARRQPQDNKLILNGPEKLFVFGDSYADTAAYLGIGSPQPYNLWKADGEAKQYGMNFAYGGAGVFDTIEGCPNMATQINYLQQLLQQNVYTKHDLTSSVALATSVGNDYGNYHGQEEFVESITKQISVNLKRIHEMGVPKVAVTAMQPLGCLPLVAFSTGNYPNCDQNTNNITRFHNQMLKQRIDQLNYQTDGSPFVVLDLYAAFTSALNIKHDQHPGKSSFPHPLAPCCHGKCGEVDLSGKKEYGVCDDPKVAFFWDLTHPSQQGWFAVYSGLKSSLPHLFQPQQATAIV
ncbi:PREDICTED: GDSL esterase/lipase At5g03610-like isoform X2 [Ipomoea nil]|uniref:GDSL esterase/lipase At5g03610-like isoform X2 n=1 Tax=Ipomoea nil TaxID=35883 RepID=UPI0009017A04|nr:PREDICTED: GDSL esterase/lipase At5g03610-like isoform X2 [Ipomoea nil]